MDTAQLPEVRIFLLGPMRIECDGREVHLPTRKAQSLLAYLLVHPGSHSREKLAALLWGDSADKEARGSLRAALASYRREFGPEFLFAGRDTVEIDRSYPLWVDTEALESQAAQALAAAVPEASSLDLSLYRGEFLQDFYDDWILPSRQHYHQLYVDLLLHLTNGLIARAEYAQAIRVARRVLAVDPGHEPAHRALIFCHFTLGDRDAALKQYESCERSLAEEYGVEPSDETGALYRRITATPVRRPAPMDPGNLPRPLTSFVGREADVQRLEQMLVPRGDESDQGPRLITLSGPGGSGKTRLAIQVAARMGGKYPDGLWWVDLGALGQPQAVPWAIARALGLRDSGRDTIEEQLAGHLRDRQVLLLLDNCEHVIAECARLAEIILTRCPALQIVATSREVLNVPGETIWQVAPLALPPPGVALDPPALLGFEAIRLFVDRARAAAESFALTSANAPAVEAICRQLDGMPLAIELAAARTRAITAEQIAARLKDRFDLLDHTTRTTSPRHQTLRQLIDWSYDLLTEAEQALFRRLSVFAGDWSLEAAEFTCSGGTVEQREIPYLMSRLIDKSLVLAVPAASETRYRLLLVIQQHASEKLEAAGEAEQVRSRHLEFLVRLAETTSARSTVALRAVERERNNIRAALEWEPKARKAAESQLRLVVALGRYWREFGYLREGSTWTERCRARATAAAPGLRARAAVQAAACARGLGNYEAAVLWGREGLELCRRLGDRQGAGEALCDLGVLAHFEGDHERAVELLDESLTSLQEADAPWQRLQTLLWLGDVQMRRGFAAEAAASWQASLTLARELGDEWGLGFSLGGLGDLARAQGDYAQASDLLTESFRLHHNAGFKIDLCYVLEALALLAAERGWGNEGFARHRYLRHAARLWGAAEALREIVRAPAPPSYRETYAPDVLRVRVELEEGADPEHPSPFLKSWEEGRSLTWDQLLAEGTKLRDSTLP